MSEVFIVYRPYKDLSWVESMLMSWIVSLSDAKQVVCFSNEYAGRLLKQSPRNISRAISKLKSLGLINTFQPLGDKRFIHLLKYPEIEVINLQSCDLEGIDNMTTPHRQDVYTHSHNDYTPTTNVLPPIDKVSINNIEYNKEYNKDVSMLVEPYPTDFIKLVELYKEDGVNTERAFSSWNKLDIQQKKMALDNVGKYLLYLQKANKNKKELHFYLSDGAFTWNAVKNYREQKKVITDIEKQNKLKNQLNIQ